MRGTILLVLALLAAPAAAERPAASDHTTPGGIAFRHVTLADQPRHAIAFGWHDGFALARPGREGVVLLGRRLLLEGTAELNRNAYSERLKDLGAATNLGGTIHTTQGLVTAAPDQLAAAVGLFAGVLANPAMAPDRLAFLQKTAAATARAGDENAEQLARGMMHRLTLGAGPLLDAVTQPAASFLAVTPDDVAAWRRTVLVRDRVLVASAGPMTPAAVAVEIDRLFAGLPAYSSDAAPAPAPVMRANARLIVLERAVAQTVVVAGGPSGWTTGPDQLRGAIAIQSLLGFEGRMFRALRERLGATYGVQANLTTFHGEARAFSILSAVDSTKAAEAIAAIRSEYARLVADGLTEAEVAPLKVRQITGLDETFRQSPAAAQLLLRLQLDRFPADYLARFDAQVRGYDAASINDGLRTRFPAPPLTFVVVAPSASGLGADCVIKAVAEIGRCE